MLFLVEKSRIVLRQLHIHLVDVGSPVCTDLQTVEILLSESIKVRYIPCVLLGKYQFRVPQAVVQVPILFSQLILDYHALSICSLKETVHGLLRNSSFLQVLLRDCPGRLLKVFPLGCGRNTQ